MKTEFIKVCNQEMGQKEEKDRGSSLIELIIVIAMMAILAVVIAPYITKYVGRSRILVDQSNMSLCESATKTALANEKAYTELVATSGVTIDVKSEGITSTTITIPTFLSEINEILTSIPVPKMGSYFEITIPVATGKIGKITVSVKP
ncbi:type II secretion system protein [Anaerosporobacter sp.]